MISNNFIINIHEVGMEIKNNTETKIVGMIENTMEYTLLHFLTNSVLRKIGVYPITFSIVPTILVSAIF